MSTRTSGRKYAYRRGLAYFCPHCESDCTVRSNRAVSRSYRQAYVECVNTDCGWRGKVDISAVSTLCPSNDPHPSVSVPLSPVSASAMRRALADDEARHSIAGKPAR